MKRNKRPSTKKNYIGIISVVILLVILAVIFLPGNKEPTIDDTIEQEQENTQEVLEEAPQEEDVPETTPVKEETTPVTSKKVGEEGLCEDYFFEQGDSLSIVGHDIFVERIGANALRLVVDDENYVLSDDDSLYAGDGIRVAIAKDAILYFGSDDPSNAVMMRVGCNYNTNPNEKYVEQRGKTLCTQLYESCQETFDIELE